MEISCIIPTKNRRHMVAEAVESALAQEKYDVEVVVIDDGSTDDTSRFLHEFYPGVRYLHRQNGGPGIARNSGAEVARGDILMFLDSDDRWLPDHAARLIDVLAAGYDVAYGTTLTHDRIREDEFFIPDQGNGMSGDCLNALARWCFLVPSSVAVRRDAFEEVGGFPAEQLGEDWAFFISLAEKYAFGFAGPDPITVRCLHEGSLCHLKDKLLVHDLVQRVGELLHKSGRLHALEKQRLLFLEKFVAEKCQEWNTIQDWYCAMKNEGFI